MMASLGSCIYRRLKAIGDQWPCGGIVVLVGILGAPHSSAQPQVADQYLEESRRLSRQGLYFKSARYAFAAAQQSQKIRPIAYARVTDGLVRAGLTQAASYFFIRTLQTENRVASQLALTHLEKLILRNGVDILRPYIIKHSKKVDFNKKSRSAFAYVMGKHELLAQNLDKSLKHLEQVHPSSPLRPYADQLAGTAWAIQGDNAKAIRAFQSCKENVDQIEDSSLVGQFKFVDRINSQWKKYQDRQIRDLYARCQAGIARVYYQANQFLEAELAYDKIPKQNFVWTDILFEQAWNAFAKKEYNRTLGKLVSYKSPDLGFVFNSEVDVLRAQTYLALCLYQDANRVVNQFNRRYSGLADEIRNQIEANDKDLNALYRLGKTALGNPLHSKVRMFRVLNRFVRNPYFQNLVASESVIASEMAAVDQFQRFHKDIGRTRQGGFPGFLREVLNWKKRSVGLLGGAFVKNSLIDHQSILISDFDRISFIKLEMLNRAKNQLKRLDQDLGLRGRGNILPERKDYQYFWEFNGEFWNDEIGDYVFGLASKCET